MERMTLSVTRLGLVIGLLAMAGCLFPVRREIDAQVCDLSAHAPDACAPVDHSPMPVPENLPKPSELKTSAKPADGTPMPGGTEEQQAEKPKGGLPSRVKVPPGLPGGGAPPITLPPPAAGKEKEREAAIDKLYPALPPLGNDPAENPGPEGHPLTLGDLQRLASANSPTLRQAAADVTATRGAAIQAGLPKNPTFGFEDDTAGTAGGAGYLGGFIDQVITTAGKLKLAQAAAAMDYFNAQVALRRARIDVAGQVRAGYFSVLVARENMRVSRTLTEFTEELFRIQVEQVKGGQAAAYEPMQLRVLATQARGALVQARNRYTSAWKQLAAALGLPGMLPTELSGRPDMTIPGFKFEPTLARVLQNHTDVLTAQNAVQKARYNLRLAKVTAIPDVEVRAMLQKDFTGPPFEMAPSIAVSAPIPVWDRNQGGIIQAQAQLVRAVEESHRVRNDLTTRLADAFERYENNRVLLSYYRDQILPDQVRAYRGVYERHQQQPDLVGFGDIVQAQQTLATAITTYIATLGAQWTAVVDVSTLMQIDDLFSESDLSGDRLCVTSVADLLHLMPLPCGHACSMLKDPALKGGDGRWPDAAPPKDGTPTKEPAPKKEVTPGAKGAVETLPEPDPIPPATVPPLAKSAATQAPLPSAPVLPPASEEQEAPVLPANLPPVRRTFTPKPEDDNAPPALPTTPTRRIPALPDE
jgi:cobalt-zinc-cadmium efflux system outer membrane protein